MSDYPNAFWHAGLQCAVRAVHIDFAAHIAKLQLFDGHCCDMVGAITLVEAMDPEIRQIETFSGGAEDTTYILTGNESDDAYNGWEAFLPNGTT